jgi:hypothetical protein
VEGRSGAWNCPNYLENKGFEVEDVLEPNVALVGRVIRIENSKGEVLSADQKMPKGSFLQLISGTTTDELGFGSQSLWAHVRES